MLPQRSPSPPPMTSRPPLPPGHFLSLPPSYSEPTSEFPSGAPSTSSHTTNGQAPNTASLAAADFDVDVRTGFLPATRNIDRLPAPYDIWEDALNAARGSGGVGEGLRLGGGREQDTLWRIGIESMPVLDIQGLYVSLPIMRRAHLVLAFLLHYYAHTSPLSSTPRTTPLPIPPSISVPILTISPLLGLPPILTYADTVLYNFHSLNSLLEPSLIANPPTTALATFTGTRSEEQFYIISALCEIAGSEALRLMRKSLDELFLADEVALKRLTGYLRRLAVQIDKIGDITLSMIKQVDPEDFYHLIRPWFRGGDGEGPTSAGWDYLGFDEGRSTEYAAENRSAPKTTQGRLFSGPSAGQSSLIHAIDIFLTVDHAPDEEPQAHSFAPGTGTDSIPSIPLNNAPVSSSTENQASPPPSRPNEATFVQRMLQYMPLPHRTFLLHLATNPQTLRHLVVKHATTHPKLAAAYDETLEALKRFREKHMRVVSVFIVQQARRQPSERVRRILGMPDVDENDDDDKVVNVEELRGTGGSPLFKFLKRCRDNTTRSMVGKSAGPTYELR